MFELSVVVIGAILLTVYVKGVRSDAICMVGNSTVVVLCIVFIFAFRVLGECVTFKTCCL